ncbi:hypothetical protein KUL118_31220 [Tenacibaculum sp. KUL118]|uniref:hypothetical protein n=1 Tax=Tenacibaculum sp. XPcli2-G TaxID=2954503 RepID=UPI0012E5F1DF|nr:hypothetical protein [Tenacibaculum sp. XPcli2-G]MCO7184900.1 hypothetical protein [Tenacibaculum sp. XPcli2-G]GFD80260.1 hypothetical protein KUL118_31220 [Tenacibaculum sp. KUL118]
MKDYTDDEFSKLSLEEKIRLFDLEAEKEYQKQIKLRDEIYPNYSFQEKVSFWSGRLHQQMRW